MCIIYIYIYIYVCVCVCIYIYSPFHPPTTQVLTRRHEAPVRGRRGHTRVDEMPYMQWIAPYIEEIAPYIEMILPYIEGISRNASPPLGTHQTARSSCPWATRTRWSGRPRSGPARRPPPSRIPVHVMSLGYHSFLAHEFGEPGVFFVPKLTDLYHENSMLT